MAHTSTRATVVGMGAGEMGDADRKLRVLCLHGFTQNGETFRQRTGSIRKQLKKKIDFVLNFDLGSAPDLRPENTFEQRKARILLGKMDDLF